MENHVTGIRLHDINEGIVTVSSGLVNRYYRITKLMGAVAQVSGLLAGQQQTTYYTLLTATGELGIDDTLLDRVLSEMQELDFARVKQHTSEDHSVDIKVPLVRDRYRDIGQRWQDLNPCSIEATSIQLVNDLAAVPRYRDELFNKHEIRGTEESDIIKDILTNSSVLSSYISPANGQEVLFSPLYWECNPEKLASVTAKLDLADVGEAIQKVKGYQGLPETNVSPEVLQAVAQTGLLPITTVVSSAGPKRFLFTPVKSAAKLEKDVVKKAFALISSIRYGQHHAQITKLHFSAPELLEIIKDRKRIGPHSEILAQYSPAVNLMVGRVREGPAGRYTFHLDDTDENLRALDIAIELTSIGETIARSDKLEAATKLLLPPGTFREPARTRLDIRRSFKPSKSAVKRISDIISGVSPDVI